MHLNDRHFLVTGGSGFVGSHVVDRLLAQGAGRVTVFDAVPRPDNLTGALATGRVTLVEGDVTDPEGLARAFAGVDGVFHAAVLGLGPCNDDPRRCVDVNVVGTFNVFDAARAAGVRKIVFSSASSVYGDTTVTMDETHPLGARTWYGASKVAGEYFLHAMAHQNDLEYVILRYMNVYGPRQDAGLIPTVLRRIRGGQPPVIMGEGSQSFDFVHVADVASANVAAMASELSGLTLNVGSGTEVSVKEIVELLLQLTGSELEPEYRPTAEVAMFRRVGSNAQAVKHLNWHPAEDIESGLASVVEATAG